MNKIWKTFFSAWSPNKIFDYRGKATPAEFWYFVLVLFAIQGAAHLSGLTLGLLGVDVIGAGDATPDATYLQLMASSPFFAMIGAISMFFIASILPSLSLMTRRYRDTGLKGWHCAAMVIAGTAVFIGSLVSLAVGMSGAYATTWKSGMLEMAMVFCMITAEVLFFAHVFILAAPTDAFAKRTDKE